MTRSERETEQLARDAADRIDQDRERGEQLGLLPEPELPPIGGQGAADGGGKVGRPAGAKNKGSSQLREWMAARGLRMPEEVIAEMAGLRATGLDAFGFALAQTERLLAHVGETAENRIWTPDRGHVVLADAWKPSPGEFIDTFRFFYGMARQAAADLMPYGTPKASPDVNVNQAVFVNVPSGPSAPADRGAQARDVTPSARRMAPADVRHGMQQNQGVGDGRDGQSDGQTRTDGTND
ncbi:hypothetical protein [Mameliella alba]|uniref:hypothetical protein n=1 Tax=Mameliella alba TaxID=561184 RepID=UPI000B53082B|nr:hypothetical protein [Mameliella alba]OWV39411.1 hypothetical protein CDZ95_26145 [Mameliella alba]